MLTAIILVGVERPTVITEPLVETAPIEIELVTLPDQLESKMAAGMESAKSAEGKAGEEIESSFESATEIEESEAIGPEAVASNSETTEKDIAAESLKTDVVEEVIVDTETSTAENSNSEIVNSEAVESEVVVPETNQPATELELLSGATATVATTIKKSDNGTGNAGKGVDGESLNKKGLDKKSSSKGDDAAPITGGYAPFSMAPQSPMAGNIITNNNNKNSTYQKSDTEIKSKQGKSKGDNSRSLVSIIPALPFEHELVDSDYAITEENWLIAPRFTVTNLEQYKLDSDNNNNNNSENENITVYFSLSIDTRGRIKEITTIRSSGSEELDQLIKEDLMKARLKAFDKNGKSLAGIATITLEVDSH